MNFSEVFKLSGQLCKFSPDGKYLVSGRGSWAEGGLSAGGACPPRIEEPSGRRARGEGYSGVRRGGARAGVLGR